jgi:hypothetical protein
MFILLSFGKEANSNLVILKAMRSEGKKVEYEF